MPRRFERRLEAEAADVREELGKTQEILELERQRREARDQELRVLRAELARYGEDPETVKRRSDDLVQQLAALRDELSRRPPADEVSELRQQAKAAAEAQDEAAHWRQRHDTVERQLRYQLVSVGELEVLRDERDILQAQRETLRQAIAQQRSRLGRAPGEEGLRGAVPRLLRL